ncbi:MAG TPA: V-type ATP synthase subunit I [Phycisphaerales bacterium]|nr:V-type ATP synthase subunit I [Phycisphaerales bacterium]
MAISKMAKVIIVSHRTEAAQLLEVLQRDGICQILNAEEAMVSKDFPELSTAGQRPKDIEELVGRLTKAVAFLKKYAQSPKGLAAALSPRTVVDRQAYNQVVSDESILRIIEQCEQTEAAIEKLNTESENLCGTLEKLAPWTALETPVEEIGRLKTATALIGLLPAQKFAQILEQAGQLGAAIQQIATAGNNCACLVVCLNENLSEVQKLLRSADFEPVSFESMTGTVAELIEQHSRKLDETRKQLQAEHEKAVSLSENLLKLQILCDHYGNLLNREQTRGTAPATEATVILEGWVREKDYAGLAKIVSGFGASSLSRIERRQGEEIPVEIENNNFVRPFEVVTRLYGMPQHFEVDPTALLAPFFALFFALCLTDAGYGLVLIGLMVFFIRKMQGDTKLMWMLVICSAATVVAGAMTGGWFGDAVQQFIPALEPIRARLIWFDPLEKPMMFFGLSLALGYFQILTGLVIAFVHNLKRKEYVAAVCDQLTWLVMLNSLVVFGASKAGSIPAGIGKFAGMLAIVPAGMIFLFSHREGGWGGRLGMGFYNLFSAIFYMGDVLSYLRLMALGMVTAGLAMAINVIAKITLDIPYGIGIVVTILVLVGGHSFNIAINALGAFVHTLRLQYVEFFPKFLVGGGRLFEPLSKEYKHIYLKKA